MEEKKKKEANPITCKTTQKKGYTLKTVKKKKSNTCPTVKITFPNLVIRGLWITDVNCIERLLETEMLFLTLLFFLSLGYLLAIFFTMQVALLITLHNSLPVNAKWIVWT